MRYISNKRLAHLRDGGFTEDQIDNICAVFNLRKPPAPDLTPVKPGDKFLYKHNNTEVYVSSVWKDGRWEYADLYTVDGDHLFNSHIPTHELTDNKYKFWMRVL